MTHTPGPLTVKLAEDDSDDFAIVDAEGRVIGEAFHLVYLDTRRPAKANAILWATSPDLLEALEAIEQSLIPYRGHDVGPERTYICSRIVIKQARAAIAKARRG